eukprot:Skav219041  [mRNA]  locus=scaffold2272:713:1453:+ [translate_table: standard]
MGPWAPGKQGQGESLPKEVEEGLGPREVQGREKYIQKGEWPEKRPEEHKEMKEGSQRWRRIKELEQQCLEERREVLAQREENLQAQREQQEELLKQIQLMQKMQEEQTVVLRGLQQSQAASSSAPPAAPSGLEKSQTRPKVLLTPARPTNRHDPKKMDETIQKWKAELQKKREEQKRLETKPIQRQAKGRSKSVDTACLRLEKSKRSRLWMKKKKKKRKKRKKRHLSRKSPLPRQRALLHHSKNEA